jgi:hypothetical protein
MHKLLPFLLCLACAPASSPGTYAKGTYRPPVRAPTFSPAEDAPHTFEPGRPAPVQPGPIPARVLPQTPETRKAPGIWASDEPKASKGPALEFDEETRIPLPKVKDEAERGATEKCLNAVHFASMRLETFLARTAPDLRMCMFLRMWRWCMEANVSSDHAVNTTSIAHAVKVLKPYERKCFSYDDPDLQQMFAPLFSQWRTERLGGNP